MKKLILSIFILNSVFGYAQNDQKIEQIINIHYKNKDDFEIIDRDKIILEITSKTDETTLISAIEKSKSDDTKYIAIESLFKKNKKAFISELRKFVNSSKKLKISIGCTISTQLVSSSFLEIAFRDDNTLNFAEKEEIISILRSSTNKELFIEGLYMLPSSPSAYALVREKVIQLKNEDLITLLADYKNPNDIDLIKSFGAKSYRAIYKFPDEKFLPFLEQQYNKKEKNFRDNNTLLEAISRICHPRSKEILEKEFSILEKENNNEDLISFQFIISRTECPLYQSIEEKLWLDHKIISLDFVTNKQKNSSAEDLKSFLTKGFYRDGNIKIDTYLSHKNENSEIYINEFDFSGISTFCKIVSIIKDEKDAYKKAVGDFITQTEPFYLPELVSTLQDNLILIENGDRFLEKMKSENAYTALNITETIFSLKNKELSDKAFNIIKLRKKEFESSEIWKKTLTNFLLENHLKID